MDRAVWTAVATAVMFVTAPLASLELVALWHSWWIWTAGTLVLVAAGLGLRRWRLTRLPAVGGLLGLTAATVLVAVNAVVVLLR